jgi:hypothetical protein
MTTEITNKWKFTGLLGGLTTEEEQNNLSEKLERASRMLEARLDVDQNMIHLFIPVVVVAHKQKSPKDVSWLFKDFNEWVSTKNVMYITPEDIQQYVASTIDR